MLNVDSGKSESESNAKYEIIAESEAMQKTLKIVKQISNVDSNVLIEGESGVGKGIISRYIHDTSPRREFPFVTIDCGAIPSNLIESELFGYEKGAFTGADRNGKVGMVQMANQGTLFLDEIGDLPLNLQGKLLRMIQTREIFRVGGVKPIPLNVRVIAATNRKLDDMMEKKLFREDLYYRLKVIVLNIEPLRNRRNDIGPLIKNTLQKNNRRNGVNREFSKDCFKALLEYDWPGNVRELENTVEYLAIISENEIITYDKLPDAIRKNNVFGGAHNALEVEGLSMKEAMSQFEKNLLLDAMIKSKNITEMSELLKVDRSTISRKMVKYGLAHS